MALEVVKTSAYQNNVNPVAKHDAGGSKGVDVNLELVRNQPKVSVQPVEDQDNNTELPASEQYIKSEISKANRKLKNNNIKCEFGYHEETRRVTIKVMDRETEEVIREIPPEKTLEMIQKMWELAGFLVDERR